MGSSALVYTKAAISVAELTAFFRDNGAVRVEGEDLLFSLQYAGCRVSFDVDLACQNEGGDDVIFDQVQPVLGAAPYTEIYITMGHDTPVVAYMAVVANFCARWNAVFFGSDEVIFTRHEVLHWKASFARRYVAARPLFTALQRFLSLDSRCVPAHAQHPADRAHRLINARGQARYPQVLHDLCVVAQPVVLFFALYILLLTLD